MRTETCHNKNERHKITNLWSLDGATKFSNISTPALAPLQASNCTVGHNTIACTVAYQCLLVIVAIVIFLFIVIIITTKKIKN